MTNHDLLRDILVDPFDDAPRLIYADWLEEYGEAERAEFIRLQCAHTGQVPVSTVGYPSDYICDRAEIWNCKRCLGMLRCSELFPLVRNHFPLDLDLYAGPNSTARRYAIVERGFVSAVHCTLAEWYGGECQRCGGDGLAHGEDRPFEWSATVKYGKCVICRGTGRIPGIGPKLVSEHPIVRVDVSDKRPWRSDHCGYTWIDSSLRPELGGLLLGELFGRLLGGQAGVMVRGYQSEQAALDALSLALVNWAREKAGLPTLEPVETTT